MKKSPTHIANKHGQYDVIPDQVALWDEVRAIIETELQKKSFKKMYVAPFESKSFFSDEILAALKLEDLSELTSLWMNGLEMVVEPPGPLSLLRAALEHKLVGTQVPLRLYSVSDLFQTADQKKVLIKSEIIGDVDPVRDAEVILSAYQTLQRLGYENLVVQVNSVGTVDCRNQYLEVIEESIGARYGHIIQTYGADPINLFSYLQMLDKEFKVEIPQLIDHLSSSCQDTLRIILEFLDVLDIPYLFTPDLQVSPGYFDQTYFVIFSQDYPDKILVRGGRHDSLVSRLTKSKTIKGAVGMEFDMANILLTYQKTQEEVYQKPSVFIASIGLASQKAALKVLSMMHEESIPTYEAFYETSLKSQLELAREKKVKIILIIGKKEAIDNSIILRDRLSDNQETISMDRFMYVLRQRLFEEAD